MRAQFFMTSPQPFGLHVICEIVNLIVTPGSLRINIVCPQVAHSYRPGQLSVPQMIVAVAQLTRRCFGTGPLHTIPSFFLKPSLPIKAHMQLCPHARPHPSDEYK
ncbi:hypothetical protein ACTXT7_008532 [Hymenolepis weldensis]